MERAVKEASIRRLARMSRGGRDTVLWSRHAISRLATTVLSRSAVEDALASCEIIEDYPTAHRPLPDCLVLAVLERGESLHAVVAIDEPNERIYMVTVYRPDPARWLDERTRRSR